MSTLDFDQWLTLLEPPKQLTLSEWAEENFVLSSEYSARSGPLHLHPFQKEIFDSFTDPKVKKIVCMCASQIVKTLLMQAVIAYVVTETPMPILLVEPTDKDARSFSKERLEPMIRDIPSLRGRLTISGAGKDGTQTDKMFPGGSLSLVGAGSAVNLKRRSIAVLAMDEIDDYDKDVGYQGDVISLAEARLITYGSRAKTILCCSPTNEHTSRIAFEYQNSDQRQPWVKCLSCGERQILEFAQVKWNNELPIRQRAATAHYECIHCAARWDDLQRMKACKDIEWRAQQPFAGTAGFWINHLYSPWHSLANIVTKFLEAKDDWAKRKTFVNTTLAELWKTDGIAPDESRLFARRELYPFNDNAVVPARACFLTASVDFQQSPPRLECEVVAWGRAKESWSMGYYVIQPLAADGKTPLPVTGDSAHWTELEQILNRDWPHENGGTLPIMLMAVDTGFNAKAVYEFVGRHTQMLWTPAAGMKLRAIRSVVPVRGNDDELKLISQVSTENAARKRQDIRIVTVGTHCAKSELYEILRNVYPDANEPVPNCAHFPMYNLEYFTGLCAEHRLIKPNGTHTWEKKPNVRNEPLDLRVYNRAAASLVGLDSWGSAEWDTMEARVPKTKATVAPVVAPQVAPAPVQQRPQQRPGMRFNI